MSLAEFVSPGVCNASSPLADRAEAAPAWVRRADPHATASTPLHALITDHAMPGLSGLELVELALERQPDLPALAITGYGRDSDLGHLPERVGVLAKPFTRDEFIKRIQTLLGACLGG
jgi:CheY-like chemotaxis protein